MVIKSRDETITWLIIYLIDKFDGCFSFLCAFFFWHRSKELKHNVVLQPWHCSVINKCKLVIIWYIKAKISFKHSIKYLQLLNLLPCVIVNWSVLGFDAGDKTRHLKFLTVQRIDNSPMNQENNGQINWLIKKILKTKLNHLTWYYYSYLFIVLHLLCPYDKGVTSVQTLHDQMRSQTTCWGLMEVLLIECIWGVINAKHFRCDKQALGLGFKPTLFQC